MKAIEHRLQRLQAQFTPARPEYLTMWWTTAQYRKGLEYASYHSRADRGGIVTENVRLNMFTLEGMTEAQREQWLEKQRSLKPPGTPPSEDDSRWDHWYKMRENGSIDFRE